MELNLLFSPLLIEIPEFLNILLILSKFLLFFLTSLLILSVLFLISLILDFISLSFLSNTCSTLSFIKFNSLAKLVTWASCSLINFSLDKFNAFISIIFSLNSLYLLSSVSSKFFCLLSVYKLLLFTLLSTKLSTLLTVESNFDFKSFSSFFINSFSIFNFVKSSILNNKYSDIDLNLQEGPMKPGNVKF